LDGAAGTVRAVTEDAGEMPCLVVRPGRLRAKHVIPAAAVRSVDPRQHRVFVKMTKHQIKDAPEPWELDRAFSPVNDPWRPPNGEGPGIDQFRTGF
jgi:hypothetical protein